MCRIIRISEDYSYECVYTTDDINECYMVLEEYKSSDPTLADYYIEEI